MRRLQAPRQPSSLLTVRPHSDECGPSGGSPGQPGRGSVASRCRTACVAALRCRSSGAASNSARHLWVRSSSSWCTDSDVVRIELFRSSGASSSKQMMCGGYRCNRPLRPGPPEARITKSASRFAIDGSAWPSATRPARRTPRRVNSRYSRSLSTRGSATFPKLAACASSRSFWHGGQRAPSPKLLALSAR